MKGRMAGGLGLWLGVLAARALAGDVSWHPAAAPSPVPNANAGILGRPVPLEPTLGTAPAPVVFLGCPQTATPIGTSWASMSGGSTPHVIAVSYSPERNDPAHAVYRGKSIDEFQPMPSGPPLKGPTIIEGPEVSPHLNSSDKTPTGSSKPLITSPTPLMMEGQGDGTLFGNSGDCGCGGDICEGSAPCCDSCCDSCCEGCCEDGFSPRLFWLRGEYLLWTIKKQPAPPLLTTGPHGLGNQGGELDQPTTTVLFGGPIDMEEFSGGRLTAGIWLDPCQCFGLEGSAFFLGKRHSDFNASGNGDPLLARPFIDTRTGTEERELVSGIAPDDSTMAPPGASLAGTITINAASEMWGAEANGIYNLWRGPVSRLDMLAGFRYLYLKESLVISENLVTTLPVSMGSGTIPDFIQDSFATQNRFYGGQLGLRHEWYWRRWQVETTGKVAVGNTQEVADLGFARIAGQPQTGLLVTPQNAGHYTHNKFGVVPQVGINLGYQLTEHWRAFAGYDFLYWNRVARPGNQTNRLTNGSELGGIGTGPAFTFGESSFWAQGVSFGMEFRY